MFFFGLKTNIYFINIHQYVFVCVSMGGGIVAAAVPPPPTTAANNHQSPPPFSSTVSHVSSNYYTESSYLIDEGEIRSNEYSTQTNIGSVPSQTEVQNAIVDLQR